MAPDKAMLNKKADDAKKVIEAAFEQYPIERLAIAWTGGKDSTLVLFLICQVCQEKGLPLPTCFCIDEGDMFDEIRDFLKTVSAEWGVTYTILHNDDVSRAAGGVLGSTVKVADLNERNRREIARLGYEDDEFAYEPESFVGNHLMKTVTLNVFLEKENIQGFFEGIRWDEQAARANEEYFSSRVATPYSPAHMRISPILHFTERDVWDAHFEFGIPHSKLYEHGFRSLGARISTTKRSEIPAWEQDLENTYERGGRRQDKEDLMEKLRKLGYM
jgi:phosphoadenosine phosphosulfate reductase